MNWNLADAKNRLSEVLDRARRDGPQTIKRRGDTFVLMPTDQYERLTGQKPSFTDWLLKGPRIDDLELPRRDASPMRDVSL
ncbi:MAG: type II toxin-antitoxin system Phd/YefM family antitoxin [Phycisphaerales bacterium]